MCINIADRRRQSPLVDKLFMLYLKITNYNKDNLLGSSIHVRVIFLLLNVLVSSELLHRLYSSIVNSNINILERLLLSTNTVCMNYIVIKRT